LRRSAGFALLAVGIMALGIYFGSAHCKRGTSARIFSTRWACG
jgi:hypothetical protein